jgi:hypothetical protein
MRMGGGADQRPITLPAEVWDQYRKIGGQHQPRCEGFEVIEHLVTLLINLPHEQMKNLLLWMSESRLSPA